MTTDWSPQVARAMHELSNATPAPPAYGDLVARRAGAQPPRRPRLVVSVGAALMAAAAIVVMVVIVNRHDAAPVDGPIDEPSGSIAVHHSQIQVTLQSELVCAKTIDTAGTFGSMVIDVYSDRAGRRWRNQVTYPDGSTHDIIVTGSAIYPTGHWVRGAAHGSSIGCVGTDNEPFILFNEPTAGDFYTLTVSAELAADERPYVRLFDDVATRATGVHLDSRGRPSELWEQRIDGMAGYGSTADHPVTQITDWWVDPADGTTVTERRYSSTVDQFGTVTDTQTVVVDETIAVPDDFFATDGYRQLPTFPRPEISPIPDPTAGSLVAPPTTTPTTTTPTPAGDAAVWVVATGQSMNDSSETFTADVSRLGCNDGVTGHVLEPDVQIGPSEIIVTFTVDAATDGMHTCPSNDVVPYEVHIGEPIGGRPVVDGACLPGAAAATTSFCADGPVRIAL